MNSQLLLALMRSQRLNLLLHCLQVERRRILHWWEVHRRAGQPLDGLLCPNKPPRLAREKLITVPPSARRRGLPEQHWRPLARVQPKVHANRDIGLNLRSWPTAASLQDTTR